MASSKPLKPGRPGSLGRVLPATVLALGVVVSCYQFVAPGHPRTVDIWPHLARTKIVYEAMRDGFSPFHTFMFYSGYPHLRFYSPLLYILGGFAALVSGGDILLSLRIVLLLLHVLSAGAMYLYLKRRRCAGAPNDNTSAALGALVYVLVPWRVRHMAVLASYPQALLYLLLPLLLLVLDRLVERPSYRKALLLGLLFALAVLSHVIYAIYAAAFLLICFLLGSGQPATAARAPRRRGLSATILIAAAVAIGLAAFFLVPFLAEYRSHTFPQAPIVLPPPNWKVALGLERQVSGYAGGYLGISIIVLALIAAVSLFSGPDSGRKSVVAALAGTAGSLLLTFVVPLLGRYGLQLAAGLPPERFLLFFVFFAATLAASACSFLRSRITRFQRRPVLLFAIITVLVAIDCLPAQLRVRYPMRKDDLLMGRGDLYRSISTQKPSRVLDLNVAEDRIDEPSRIGGCPAMDFVYGDLPTPFGPPFHQFAPRSMLYAYPWINLLAVDLADTTTQDLSANSTKALSLLGVSHVIAEPTFLGFSGEGGTRYAIVQTKGGINWDTRRLQAQGEQQLVYGATSRSLVLASNSIRPFAPGQLVQSRSLYTAGNWEELLDSARIDTGRNRINFIPVREDERAESLPGQAAIEVIETRVRNQDVTVRLYGGSDCFLRLAVSYYPELRVLLDGKDVRFAETRDHFLYLRCPAGVHALRVCAPLTPLRWWMLVTSGLTLLLCAAVWVVPRRRSVSPEGHV